MSTWGVRAGLAVGLILLALAAGGSGVPVLERGRAGTLRWQAEVYPGYLPHGHPAIGPDGTLYVATVVYCPRRAKLFAFRPDGTPKWGFEVEGCGTSSPVVAADGTIYVASGPHLHAVSPDGRERWSWAAEPAAELGDLALGPDGTVYAVQPVPGAFERWVYAVGPDGRARWSVAPGSPACFGPIRGTTIGAGGEVYVSAGFSAGCPYGRFPLYALNPRDGSLWWTAELGAPVLSGGVAIGADGAIYAPTSANRLVALGPGGELLWRYDFPARPGEGPGIPTIGPEGLIYVTQPGSAVADVYALTPGGALRWSVDHLEGDYSRGIAVAADGTITYPGGWIPGTQGAALTAVGPDGAVRWKLAVPGGRGAPAIGADGTIYVVGGTTLTAVYGTLPLASASPWPRARRDNGNTGRAGGS